MVGDVGPKQHPHHHTMVSKSPRDAASAYCPGMPRRPGNVRIAQGGAAIGRPGMAPWESIIGMPEATHQLGHGHPPGDGGMVK